MPDSIGHPLCHPDFAKYLSGERMHRDDASAILEYVGKNSPAGNYPQNVPPYLLGRAVRRLVYNYIHESDSDELIEGDSERITREFVAGFLKLKL